MFITDRAEMLPPWLRFVEGVVDTEDLPLNVSRETLQSTPVLARIRRALVNRVLSDLKARAKAGGAKEGGAEEGGAEEGDESGRAEYDSFIARFGGILKEGIHDDADHREEIAALARFRSSTQDRLVSLDDYIGRMPEGQQAIYYLTGEDAERLKASPMLEGFRAKGYEVLLLDDPIDFFWPERLGAYQGRSLVHAAKAEGIFEAATADEATEALLKAVQDALGEKVAGVQVSSRLTDSPAALAAGDKEPDLALQRLMRRAGRQVYAGAPTLELNPNHALVKALAARVQAGEAMGDWAALLLDLARIQDGERPEDPARFASLVAAQLAGG
jgi:molecular chaperone HtpG